MGMHSPPLPSHKQTKMAVMSGIQHCYELEHTEDS